MFNPPTSPLARPRNNEMAIPIPTNPMVYGTLVLDENNAAKADKNHDQEGWDYILRSSEYTTTTTATATATTITRNGDNAVKNNHFDYTRSLNSIIMMVMIRISLA